MSHKKLAAALRNNVRGKWINIRGLNHGPTDKSLGVMFRPGVPDGFIVHSLAGDDLNASRAYVSTLFHGIEIEAPGAFEMSLQATSHVAKSTFALKLFEEAHPIEGTLAEVYLNSRNIWRAAQAATQALRFHPECPFGPYLKAPALLCRVQNTVSGSFQAIQRIALRDDGLGKREMPNGLSAKMLLGPASGGAIQLGKFSNEIAVAEGVESALSASDRFNVPVWSALSAAGIKSFPIISGVTRLTIFADNDDPGLRAARQCTRRYQTAGASVKIIYPNEIGADWNDYLRRKAS